jgi:hypothetical protein
MDAKSIYMTKLPPRIKVFRTRIGFNDYVVATSSKKLALEAWDVERDLFASGEAERTDDPKEIDAALEYIGKAVAIPVKRDKLAKRVKASQAKRG